jgi:hypothetical protein
VLTEQQQEQMPRRQLSLGLSLPPLPPPPDLNNPPPEPRFSNLVRGHSAHVAELIIVYALAGCW